jgi:hypothetical protein
MKSNPIKELIAIIFPKIDQSGKNFWLKIKWDNGLTTEKLSSDVIVVCKPIKILRIRKDELWRKLHEKAKV